MGTEKIVEIPQVYITDDLSLSIMITYNKIKKKKINENDYLYLNELSKEDLINIERTYSAATIFAGMGMFSSQKKIVAESQIQSLVGTYKFSTDIYRTFANAYGDLLKYKSFELSEDYVEEFLFDNEAEHKLA